MNISLNNQKVILPDGASVADLLAQYPTEPPFAVAVNTHFISKQYYAETVLQEGDTIDVVKPVAGG